MTGCASSDSSSSEAPEQTPESAPAPEHPGHDHGHDHGPTIGGIQSGVWINGDFELSNSGASPTVGGGWTVQNYYNPGVTDLRPGQQTLASLNLTSGGQLATEVLGGAQESLFDPDLGSGSTIRFPKYGSRVARVNKSASVPGSSNNANMLRQTMTVSAGDVDPTDDKVHVRFGIAPVLENPGHGYADQPYYFVQLRNVTQNVTLYQDFNTSGQAGVPWKVANGINYTDWQLVDVSSGSSALSIGDQVELTVVAAGCSAGGHWGRVYVDAVGSGLPGLYTWATGPQAANKGSNITYTLYYKNGGTVPYTNTTLRLVTPPATPNTTFVSNTTPTTGGTCSTPTVGQAGTVSCDLGTLQPGAVGSMQITIAVPGGVSESVITNGNYDIAGNGGTALLGPKVQTSLTTGVTYADVAITKSDGRAAVGWGTSTQYTVRVSNAGPAAAGSVTVADTMPAQLTGVTWSCAGTGGATCTASGSGNINDVINVPVNGVATYTINANIVSGTGSSTITNLATAAVGGGVSDPDTTNNSAADKNAVGTLRALTVNKNAAVGGTVSSAPSGLSCGTNCTSATSDFLSGSEVVLTATPASGFVFTGWGGACVSAGNSTTCSVTPTAATTVSASFSQGPYTLSLSSGSSQIASTGGAFALPLTARVLDAINNPVPNVAVTFAGPGAGAGATLSNGGSVVTNTNGYATVTATANATPGAYSVAATSGGATGSATFSLTNYGPPANLAIVSGGGQTTLVNTAFTNPLIVLLTDAAGTPVPNTEVVFSRPTSGASGTFPTPSTTVFTDGQGRASIAVTANARSGTYGVEARVGSLAQTFSLTNSPGMATRIVYVGGNTQTQTVGMLFPTALAARVEDAQGNGVPGQMVAFAVTGGTGTASFAPASPVMTDANGVATTMATAGMTPGSYTVSASMGAFTPVTFGLTNVVGAPSTLAITMGGTQQRQVMGAFATPLRVVVRDGFMNPVAGATVTFTAQYAPSPTQATATLGGGSAVVSMMGQQAVVMTNASGEAEVTATTNTKTGSYLVAAATPGATTQNFTLTNTAGPPTTITPNTTTRQQAIVTQGFSAPLSVTVLDQYANAVPGQTVAFTAPSSGAAATFTSAAVTDAAGQTSVTATANTTTGDYDATATVNAISTTFPLRNTPGPAASLTATAGGGQNTTVGTAFTNQLEVQLKDANNNGIPGKTVTFTAPAQTGASAVVSATTTTDANGYARVPATANTIAGMYTVVATTAEAGGMGPANFALTNNPGPANTLVKTPSTDNQAATVGAVFTQRLEVTVRDQYGNAVPGQVVTFAVPAPLTPGPRDPAASFDMSTSPSDAQGRVNVRATANAFTGTYTAVAAAGSLRANFALTNNPGPANNIQVQSGSGQHKTIEQSFADLVAIVTDAQGNPVPGVTVTVTRPSAGATASVGASTGSTATDGTFRTTATAGAIAGTYSVSFAAAGSAQPASFTLTNDPDVASRIVAVDGTPQSWIVNGAYVLPLTARVTDRLGNPVAGIPITFTAPTDGPSADLTVVGNGLSDATGRTSVMAMANLTAGGFQVVATSTAIPSVSASFLLTNTEDAPGTLTATAGGGQSVAVATAFANRLEVLVVDRFNNPVPNASVTFRAPPSTQATATFDNAGVAVTGTNGRASIRALAGQIVGTYVVTAEVNGAATTASFQLTNTPGAPGSIVVVDNNDTLSAPVGTQFALPLVVRVTDGFGNAVPGETVTFMVPTLGATAQLSSGTALTDSDGVASVVATASAVSGSYSASAGVRGGISTSFSLTNTPGAVGSILVLGGANQSTTVGTGFNAPLQVRVVDALGNALANTEVVFEAPTSGAAAVLTPATPILTDAMGEASVTAAANNTAGAYNVTVTASGTGSSQRFALVNRPGDATGFTIADGSAQTTQVETDFPVPLEVVLVDANGNGVSGVTVTFAAPAGGPTARLSAPTAVTDASGRASVRATANNEAGTYVVRASAPTLPDLSFGLTNAPGAVGAINVLGGTPQTAATDTRFTDVLSVRLVDAQGNPVPDVEVLFTPPATGASASLSAPSVRTDAEGRASVTATANATAGEYMVVASAPGAARPVSFRLTNTAGGAASITAVAGTQQSTLTRTAFGTALRVVVRDSHDNPVRGVAVTFAAPASGASALLSSTTVSTNTAGEASVSAVANTLPGAYDVTATVAGASAPATFSLTNTASAVARIEVASSGSQQVAIEMAFPEALLVRVLDGAGVPVPNATVTFSVPVDGASATLDRVTVTSNADGEASVTATANDMVGNYQVTAAVAGVELPAVFSLVNLAGAAAQLTVIGGGEQMAAIGAPFAQSISFRVVDGAGNPVPNVELRLMVPGTGASAVLSPMMAVTDANGVVTVMAVANQTAGDYVITATGPGTLSTTVMLINMPNPCATDPNGVACQTGDIDGDGVPNAQDPAPTDPCVPRMDLATCATGDADSDGIPNRVECPNANSCPDSDGDGTPDYRDTDSDDDGLRDAAECTTPPSCADADADGLADYIESNTIDTDGDGEADNADPDSDDDGIPDSVEGRDRPFRDADGDGIPSYLDAAENGPGSGDSDGDGVADNVECPTGVVCVDTDRDFIPDYMDEDSDSDGVPDATDSARTDPCAPNMNNPACGTFDSDGDGIPNSVECPNPRMCPDTNRNGIPDYLDTSPNVAPNPGVDTDGDGIPDLTECGGTAGMCIDTDNDGIPNGSDPDSDGDGLLDKEECPSQPCVDSDGDGIPDYLQKTPVRVSGGCSLAGGSFDASWLALLGLLGLVQRRRRRAA